MMLMLTCCVHRVEAPDLKHVLCSNIISKHLEKGDFQCSCAIKNNLHFSLLQMKNRVKEKVGKDCIHLPLSLHTSIISRHLQTGVFCCDLVI